MGENTIRVEQESLVADGRKYRTYVVPALGWLGKKGLPIAAMSVLGCGGVFALRDATTDAPNNMQTSADGVVAIEKQQHINTAAIATLNTDLTSLKHDVTDIKVALLGKPAEGFNDAVPGLIARFKPIEEYFKKEAGK